ncbi:MAG: hypothetical protein J6M10_01065 [Clostridia bacterium]|nr:hypothetical protein [Clostridia bacterium]
MKKIMEELLGSGPWEYESKAGRALIAAIVLISSITWLAAIVKLAQLGRMMLG